MMETTKAGVANFILFLFKLGTYRHIEFVSDKFIRNKVFNFSPSCR